ncbi:MAG TPA: DUF58 domain-containing protein, partial [Herpetosiphonaceae bacterium]
DPAFLSRIERLALQARRHLRGGLSGVHASRRRLPAPTVSDHRPYAVGDDLRHIDWPAYARHDELNLKLGETEQEIELIIALDRSASLDWGAGETHKGRYALRLAATLGYLGLAANDSTTVWPFAASLAKPFGPASSRARAPELLRFLSAVQPAGATAFDAVAAGLRKRNGGLLVLISDLWGGGDLRTLLKAASAPRWQTVVLHILHPEEIAPTLSGPLELEDQETGQVVALEVDDRALEEYRERLVRWVRAVQQACNEHGATYAGIRTDRSLERAVIPFLRRRRVLG